MKHLTFRDVASILLGTVGILAIVLVAAYMESGPLGSVVVVALVLSVILWGVYAVSVVHDRKKDAKRPKLKIYRNGKWIDVVNLEDVSTPRRPVNLFDQDNYKEQA